MRREISGALPEFMVNLILVSGPSSGIFFVSCTISFQGTTFTWCNNQQEPHTVSERLDRACASESSSCLFPDTRVHHVGSPYSDHSPLVIELQPRIQWDLLGGRKCFQFEAAWLQEPACADIVKKLGRPRRRPIPKVA
ncbi:UNVERIFIED_CONTAM: hypothetical protein Sradi_6511900 [Sesamum radiatum]|uniref:Endonuclease/exonuclease/phosphatase domain-containing protein n=1 Tax=Sesamum radiatum TaxID=300843 RepID=A0AAW2JW27_SESRA